MVFTVRHSKMEGRSLTGRNPLLGAVGLLMHEEDVQVKQHLNIFFIHTHELFIFIHVAAKTTESLTSGPLCGRVVSLSL